MRIVRRPAALADVDAIWEYIAEHDRASADRIIRNISRSTDRLRSFPRSGRQRSDLSPGLHSISVWPYILFYKIIDDQIEIVRVLHGAQDLTALDGFD